MKDLLKTLRFGIITWALLTLIFSCMFSPAHASELREVFTQYDTNIQIILTNQPCADEHKTGTAYALNTDTGEKALGCFTGYDEIIEIELDGGNKHFYHYWINANNFEMK